MDVYVVKRIARSPTLRNQTSFKARVNQHWKPSTNEAQNSTVYLHIKEAGHSFNIKDATILDIRKNSGTVVA